MNTDMLKDGTKDVFINIHSVHGYDLEETDTMDFMTEGTYAFTDDGCVISYFESELTGMAGTQTVLSVRPDEVCVDRAGTVTSRMKFREGLKDAFLLDTPYGAAQLGIDTRRVVSSLRPDGGKIEIDYVVNMEHMVAMSNRFEIDIQEQGDLPQ